MISKNTSPGRLPPDLPGSILILLGLSKMLYPPLFERTVLNREDLVFYKAHILAFQTFLSTRNDFFARKVKKWVEKELIAADTLLDIGTVTIVHYPPEK